MNLIIADVIRLFQQCDDFFSRDFGKRLKVASGLIADKTEIAKNRIDCAKQMLFQLKTPFTFFGVIQAEKWNGVSAEKRNEIKSNVSVNSIGSSA